MANMAVIAVLISKLTYFRSPLSFVVLSQLFSWRTKWRLISQCRLGSHMGGRRRGVSPNCQGVKMPPSPPTTLFPFWQGGGWVVGWLSKVYSAND